MAFGKLGSLFGGSRKESSIKQSIDLLNAPYDTEKVNEPVRSDKDNFKIIKNPSPVLLSAPHAVKQVREGIKKGRDVNTGGIVEYLSKSAKCNGIIRTFNKYDDPNYCANPASERYREKVCEIIKENDCNLLLDIHGCADTDEYDIYLGINHGINIQFNKDLIVSFYKKLTGTGARVAIDQGLCATRKNNVCKETAEKTGIPCIQVEISREWRTHEECLGKLIPALEEFIRERAEN